MKINDYAEPMISPKRWAALRDYTDLLTVTLQFRDKQMDRLSRKLYRWQLAGGFLAGVVIVLSVMVLSKPF
jgi:hypothetical protein